MVKDTQAAEREMRENLNLTTEEVAQRFRTSPETVRYWRSTGKGPRSWKVGKRVLYALEDVEAWEREAREGASVA
jgi:DNA-binding transcriptional MerR regulator